MGCLSRQLQRFTRTAINHIIDLSSEGLPDDAFEGGLLPFGRRPLRARGHIQP